MERRSSRRRSARIVDTGAKDLCGKAKGNRGGVGGHKSYFLCVCARERVRRRGDTPGAVVEAEGSVGPAEGNGGSDFFSGKGAAAKRIRQA